MSVRDLDILGPGRFFKAGLLADMCLAKSWKLRESSNYSGYKEYLYDEISWIKSYAEKLLYLEHYMQSAFTTGIESQHLIWKFQFMAAYDIAEEIEEIISKGEKDDGGEIL